MLIQSIFNNTKKLNCFIFIVVSLLILGSCKNNINREQEPSATAVSCQSNTGYSIITDHPDGLFDAQRTETPVHIDGCSKDAIWSKVAWNSMNYNWMGADVDAADYQGKFKLAWDSDYLYILVEVIDDHLNPTLKDGIENYWKGDYVEVFIDEDQSGGNHKFNHQAFAYHVSTDGHAIDKNTLEETVFFDDHLKVERSQEGNKHLWELAVQLYDVSFDQNSDRNESVKIEAQKVIGFSIAYGDNDGNNHRENFMGSKKTHGINNDEGYTHSDVFGQITFVE